ncbi:T9SS type A sorting domain-containing protein [Flavobacterium sp. MFBS3-15]|uniref:T9SS type A sorting domain-containing protein n=1 Tax=Flavobacterium sp. MFBS3-15 TaxID=2989816 RepID=UPI0022355E27|nr:T9SS type A sorting domain-containing protein [Flavobacterium sp. MFBS3-15]MCW4467999.1 T9SS type A sorting domain-containing protein [Flavobacterium sp. MFBS3-15]
MKLNLFTAALVSGIAIAANAQEIYSENFEGNPNDIINEGWKFVEITGNPENYGVYSSIPSIENIGIQGGSMGVASFNMVNQIPSHVTGMDIAVVSPPITLQSGESHFHYRMGSLSVGGVASSNYSIYILTAAEFDAVWANPAQLKTLLDGRFAVDSATLGNESQDATIELTDFESQEIVVVFRMHNSPGNSILLFDNLRVAAGALGNGENELAEFSIYPNPVTDIITISGTNAIIDAVRVTDLNGRTIFNKQFAGEKIGMSNLTGLSSGVYLIAVSSDNETITKKIVKQ